MPLFKNSFGTSDTAFIGASIEDANFLLNIPLFNENEGIENKIGPLSLLYSRFNKNEYTVYGYGTNLNVLKKFVELKCNTENTNIIDSITIENSDFTEIIYVREENGIILRNENSDSFIIVEYDNISGCIENFKLYDNLGNYYQYIATSENSFDQWPVAYHKVSFNENENIHFINVNLDGMEIRYDNQKMGFSFSSNILSAIRFYDNDELLCNVSFVYSDGYLTKIIKNIFYMTDDEDFTSKVIGEKEYQLNNNLYILTKNAVTGKYSKYFLNDEKVSRFINCFEDDEESGKETIITYSEKLTVLKDFRGVETKYYFKNGRNIIISSDKKIITTFEYDNKGNIISQSDGLSYLLEHSIMRGNLYSDGYYFTNNSYTAFNVSEDSVVETDSYIDGTGELHVRNSSSIDDITIKISLSNIEIKKDSGVSFFTNITKIDEFLENEVEFKIQLYNRLSNGTIDNDNCQVESFSSISLPFKKIPASKLFIAKDNYDHMDILIYVPKNGSDYYFGEMQVYNHLYGCINVYNDYGCVIKSYSGNNVYQQSYLKENNTLITTSSLSNLSSNIISSNCKNRPVEILNSDGSKIVNVYDVNDNLVKQTFTDVFNNYMETSFVYSSDGKNLLEETNNEGHKIIKGYSKNGRLVENIIYNNGLIRNKQYDDKFRIKKEIIKASNNDFINQEYSFDEKNRLTAINLDNSHSFNFEYDDYGNIVATRVRKGTNVITLEKKSYVVTDDNVYTNELESIKIGNIDSGNNCNKYKYSYDAFGNLKNIFLLNGLVEQIIAEFTYDNYNNLSMINDIGNNEIITFEYDKFNQLVNETRSKNGLITVTNMVYDLKGINIFSSCSINNVKKNELAFTSGTKNYNSPVALHNYYKNYKDDLFSCFLLLKEEKEVDNEKIYLPKTCVCNNSNKIELEDDCVVPEIVNLGDNITNAFKLDSSKVNEYKQSLKYLLKTDKDDLGKTVCFWFKLIGDNVGKTLIGVSDIEYNNNILSETLTHCISIDEGCLVKYNGSLLSNNSILVDGWNFISFTYTVDTTNNVYNSLINLNGSVSTFISPFENISKSKRFDIVSLPTQTNSTDVFDGLVTCILISGSPLSQNEVNLYKKYSFIDYINYQNTMINENFDTCSMTSRYNSIQEEILIPLVNSPMAINGEITYEIEKDDLFNELLDNQFVYDNDYLKGYGYKPNNNKLVYNIDNTGNIFIGVKVLFSEIIDYNTIFELGNSDISTIGFLVDNNKNLIIKTSTEEIATGLIIETNEVNNIMAIISLSNDYENVYTYKIILKINGGEIITKYVNVSNEVNIGNFIIGRCFSEINKYSLNGLLSMLRVSNSIISLTEIDEEVTNEKNIKTVNTLGQLVKEELYNNEKHIISKEIQYKKTVESNSTRCYNIINNENIFVDSLQEAKRIIRYDVSETTGNIERIELSSSNNVLDSVNYLYNLYGNLKEEVHSLENYRIVYTYDKAGNLLKKEKYAIDSEALFECMDFGYSSEWPDKLTTFTKGGVTNLIEYDSVMKGMPVTIRDQETGAINTRFGWKNRNLIRFETDSQYYTLFEYDYSGLRTKKTIVNNYASGFITHYYRYSGSKIIEECIEDDIKGDVYVINYFYDQNGILYGFKYKNVNYYYIRDCLGTIIGIVNSSNQLVCEYKYDAYGNHLVLDVNRNVNTLGSFIGNINPFRYKGYYYDVETGLYWISSRYYSPEWCRWISPDDIEYLDPQSINGLNLYCYCLNNPISYCDPSGHFVITTAALIAGLVAVGKAMLIGAAIGAAVGAGFEFGKQLYQNGGDFSSLDLGAIGIAALGGAVSGAISAIPIPGSGFLSYLGTFAIGGAASIAGGLVTGSVNSWETAALAFGIGGVAGVIGRGASDIVKHIKVSKQIGVISNKAQSIASMSAKNKSLAIWNMVGADNFSRNAFKSWGYNQIFDLLMTEGTNQLLINSTSNLTRYLVYSSLVSSLGSGWF